VKEAEDFLNAHINTDNPNPQELERLREAIKLVPDLAAQIGNLAFQARNRIIDAVSQNTLIKESINEKG
jgi:predicted Rossmann fold nucleotide-binding protein DprA/Smf involved in DNA uptake